MKKKKGRFFKIFLPVFLSTLLIFNIVVKPKETHAIAPIVIWAAEALVAEIAVEIGWKYVGKPAFNAIKKKIANKVLEKPDNFDFTKKKPKKNGKKLDIDISPLDRAKIASELKKEFTVIKKAETDRFNRTSKTKIDIEYSDDLDPLYSTSLELEILPRSTSSSSLEKYDLVRKIYDIELTPLAYKKKVQLKLRNSFTNGTVTVGEFNAGVFGSPVQQKMFIGSEGTSAFGLSFSPSESTHTDTWVLKVNIPLSTMEYWNAYVYQLQQNNRTIYLAEGLIVPEDNTKIYDVPLNTPSGTVLPNNNDLDIDLSIDLPNADDTSIELEWEDLTNYELDFNNYVTNVENKMDVTNNNYNIVVNNYYISDTYDKSPEELCQEIDCDALENPPETPDNPVNPEGEDGSSIWDKIIPIALLIVLFDLLDSILFYLIRMFTFFATIPVIPEKPINNEAFIWFRSARIMGVQIYNVVSTLATIGLSFAVFRIVRRIFNQ